MKKTILVLAVMTFVACGGNTGSAPVTSDSTVVVDSVNVDTTAVSGGASGSQDELGPGPENNVK